MEFVEQPTLEPQKALTKEEKKAEAAARKNARKERKGTTGSTESSLQGSSADLAALSLEGQTHSSDKNLVHRTVTGVLTSRPTSRDIKIDSFSLVLNGAQLIQDCSIELTIGRRRVRARDARRRSPGAGSPARAAPHTAAASLASCQLRARPAKGRCARDGSHAASPASRRYGLLGQNGSGKTNFLQCLANREVRAAFAQPPGRAGGARGRRRLAALALPATLTRCALGAGADPGAHGPVPPARGG
jgi:hypothetical protein